MIDTILIREDDSVRNANTKVLLIAAVLIVIVAAAGLVASRMVVIEDAVLSDKFSISPAIPKPAGDTQAYLRVQVGNEPLPLIPLTDGGEYTVTQPNGRKNVIHTTLTGAVMHFSTCDNQNCIQQGEVTLSNRQSRVMGGLIVCLPNEVLLELLLPEEVEQEA